MFEQYASFDTAKNGMFSPHAINARHEAKVAKNSLAQAQQRIAQLEEALRESQAKSHAFYSVAKAVGLEIEKVAPSSPLATQANRVKIYDANYKL